MAARGRDRPAPRAEGAAVTPAPLPEPATAVGSAPASGPGPALSTGGAPPHGAPAPARPAVPSAAQAQKPTARPTPEQAFFAGTVAASRECLELDRDFAAALESRRAEGGDPLDPDLWEGYVKARGALVELAAQCMTLMSRDRALVERNRDAADRLADAMGEVKRLEGSLAGFLSGELPELKRAIDDLSRNQAVFTSYARSGGTKHKPETLETTA